MTFNEFEDAIKWSTVYFLDKSNNQLVIRDGHGNIKFRKFDSNGFVDWFETRSELSKMKDLYDDDTLLYDMVKAGIFIMSYKNPVQIEGVSPYREFIII